jgi:hypothetical protein
MSSLMSLFNPPKVPKVPKPEPIPKEPDLQMAEQNAEEDAKRRRRMSSSAKAVLTSPLGIGLGESNVLGGRKQ